MGNITERYVFKEKIVGATSSINWAYGASVELEGTTNGSLKELAIRLLQQNMNHLHTQPKGNIIYNNFKGEQFRIVPIDPTSEEQEERTDVALRTGLSLDELTELAGYIAVTAEEVKRMLRH